MLSQKGESYNGFTVTKVVDLPELKCTLRELVHQKSGAQVMHLGCDDSENLFCLSFKTLPSSSNGVAHILEHTVLCGSRKFPVKDPFFAMNRRSLNTFMNALTGPDFTCYPAATQVEKDFYNLLDVYLDAVFHPELKEASFLQEGHRLEFREPTEPKTPLEYRGIVFNEMKGNLSSADTRLWHAMLAALFPHLPYGYNSGGDPRDIPKLSYSELIAFHETYYHPSRCLFFFYGNFPLQKHLDFIAEKTLNAIPKSAPLASIPLQPRFKEPKQVESYFPINEGEELSQKTMIAFGWLAMPVLAQEEVLALSVLDSILMDTDGSLLKHPLLQSKLCIHADAFMDIEMSEVPYLIVCKGCEKENADALQEKLFKSLEKIAREGIAPHLIDTAIHQLEFARTEISGEGSPFGLTLFMRSALAKQHGCPPENALVIHSLFETLRERTKDRSYLPSLIRKYFLNNPHMVRLTMLPDPALASKEASEERQHLDKIQKNLTQKEVQTILQQREKLALYQKETEHQNLNILPKVGLEDVPLLVQNLPLHRERFGNLEVFHHACFTNQILYVDLVFDLPALKEEELPYLQLLTAIIPEVGVGPRDYLSNLEYMQTHTGGIGAAVALHVQSASPSLATPSIVLRGKALYRKADKLFTLLNEIVTSLRLNEPERIVELILQLDTSLQNRFNRNALRYALHTALSGFSIPLHLNNSLHGLPYFKAIQQIAKSAPKKKGAIVEKLCSMKERLFSQPPHLVISCDEEMFSTLKKEQFFGLGNLPIKEETRWKNDFSLAPATSHATPISSPVAFTVEAFSSIHYLHPHAPALSCAMPLFENTILHRKIREEGGAYGTGASFNPNFGNFYFHSYRDPQIAQTLTTFQLAIEMLASGQFDQRDLEEAKLGVIQGMDHPIPPGARAATAYNLWRDGKTPELRQRYRDTLLSLTKKELEQVIQKEIQSKKEKGVIVSFASRELLESQNSLLGKKALPIIPL